ncbi:MAG: hypothetical protein ACYS8I_10615 [Planctomycetota bacterium]|jgi:hypothetical protein
MGYLRNPVRYYYGNTAVRFGLIAVLAAFGGAGCKQRPTTPAEQVTEPCSPEANDIEETVADANEADSGLVPLEIEFPNPVFTGTRPNLQRANVEDTTNKVLPPFYVPKGTMNLALGKPVYSSDEEPVIGELELVTDGDKAAMLGSFVELGPSPQHVMIDLGQKAIIYAIVVWHYHLEDRIYHDVVVQVADDPDFIVNVRTLFNNDRDNSSGLGAGKDREYVDNNNGKLINAKGTPARYVRLYSNGNTSDSYNAYTEVEVHGKLIGN